MSEQAPDAGPQEEPHAADGDQVGRRHSRFEVPVVVALAAMVAAVAFGAVILMRVAGPLYGLLFPIELPVPNGAQQIEHVKPDKGPEYWIYQTSMTGREVAAFYEKEGGTCRYTPEPPGGAASVVGPRSVALCTGQKEHAGLGIAWEVYIGEGYSGAEGPTVFRLYKYSSEVE
jgi:hypothetical protein